MENNFIVYVGTSLTEDEEEIKEENKNIDKETGNEIDKISKGNNKNMNNTTFDENEGAKNLLNSLNELLMNIADETLRRKINSLCDEYFKSTEFKEGLASNIQKELLEKIRDEIKNYNYSEKIQQEIHKIETQINENIQGKINDYLNKFTLPKVNIIKLNDIELGRTKAEFFHEKFEEVLSLVQLDEPVMLIGPAGSGKNHAVSQIASALGLQMYYTNNASNEFKLPGFIDAGGNYRDTEFYKAFTYGGMFLLDEIDTSDPSSLIVINSALANGYMAFPHEIVVRHPKFRLVAAANTWGTGSNLQYVGRNALDAATLDRFDNVFFDYDRKLEKALYPNKQVLDFMWSFRDAVEDSKIPHIVSTRGIGKVYKKEINCIPVDTILRVNVIRNLNQDDLNSIIGNMHNIDESNKYYQSVKKLELTKNSCSYDDELPF